MPGKLMKLIEVERATGLSRSTLYRRLRLGTLKGIQIDNGSWRVSEHEVNRILQARAVSK